MKYILLMALLMLSDSCFNNLSLNPGLGGSPLPSFKILLIDSTTEFETRYLSGKEATVLFYFNPDCPYCRAQTEAIISNIHLLKDVQFLMLTYAPVPEIRDYYKQYQLNKYKNIIAGQDYTAFFGRYFNTQAVPYMAIYDKNRRLKQIVIGKVESTVIKDIIQK